LALVLLLVTSIVLLKIAPSVAAGNHTIEFDTSFSSGDNVLRDFYIAVDGSNVAHDTFYGSGTLSASVSLDDAVSHQVTAWPIINHDRSTYSGSLYVDGALCAQSSDVWQGNPLSCAIPASQEPICQYGGVYPNCNPPPSCQYGGIYPNCNPPPSCQYGGSYPNCNSPPSCQYGGTYPNCNAPLSCPYGGEYPNCNPTTTTVVQEQTPVVVQQQQQQQPVEASYPDYTLPILALVVAILVVGAVMAIALSKNKVKSYPPQTQPYPRTGLSSTCRYCGARIRPDSHFCNRCGKSQV